MLVLWQSNSGTASQSFNLPLSDAGAGVANITPVSSRGSGTPTFARATPAYTRLSSGLWSLIASGSPRSMYSAAGVYLGYWREEARSNVLGGTDAIVRTMSDVGWVAGATMTVGTATGVDGGANACALLTGGAVAATNTILFTTVLASAQRTYSVRVRRVSGTGVVSITDNGGTNWTPVTLTTTEQLFQITRTQANPVVGVQVEGNGDSVAVDFNTIEAATFANPTPIPVNVSKAADSLTYPIAGNLSGTVGSCYAEVYPVLIPSGAFGRIIGDTSSAGPSPLLFQASTGIVEVFDGTAERTPTAVANQNAVNKGASSWSGSTCRVSLNGAISNSLTFDGDLGMVGLNIGGDGATSSGMYGAIANVRIYVGAASPAQLQSWTA